MAVALSTLSAGTIVRIPLSCGGTADGIVLQYNHYGKSEVSVLLKDPMIPKYYSNVGTTVLKATNTSTSSSINISYDLSPADVMCRNIKTHLAESIQGALIPVSIPVDSKVTASYPMTGYNPSSWVSKFAFETKNIERSIFLPSSKELGVTTAYYTWSAYRYSSFDDALILSGKTGTAFSYFNTEGNRNNMDIATRDIAVNCTTRNSSGDNFTFDVYPYDVRQWTINENSAPIHWKTMTNSAINSSTLYNMTIYYSSYNVEGKQWYSVNVYPILCLNGSIMVNGSSGGDITESTAVESFRKIGGKWYRTT